MNKNVYLLWLGIALLPTGCTMAPKYARPTAPVPNEWPTGAAYSGIPVVTNAPLAPDIQWHEFFTDDKLRVIIGTALTNNLDLRLAVLNVSRARAMYGIQRSQLWPIINATGSGSRQQVPGDLSSSGSRQITERYDANLGVASWEIDFFGRIRSLKDRALDEYLATDQARRSAQILLISSLANAYLALAADQDNLKLSETTREAQLSAYNLVQRRHVLGLATDLDLYRAQTPVEIARRDVAVYTQQIAKDQNALNLLMGAPVPNELLPTALDRVGPTRDIAFGLSSEVLLRRPDIIQAEALLKAAYADLGAARATFFPRISLSTAIGTASSDLSGLFKSGSGTWSYAPQIVMPIFDARTWSALQAAKVQQEIAVTQYQQAIQGAFKEVADALATRGTIDREVAAQQSLVKALSETYRLAKSRYDRGIDSYFPVLDAQRSMFAAEQVLVLLRLAKLSNNVELYAVLGGGWQTEPSANLSASSSSASAARSH